MADAPKLFGRFKQWMASFQKRFAPGDETRNPAPLPHDNPQVFVLWRELSEVHLLLDNLSADPNKDLPDLHANHAGGLPRDWLEKVCRMSGSPSAVHDPAKDAALLIRVKDVLNRIAKPATGRTIAFTLFYTREASTREERASDGADKNAPTRYCLAWRAYPDLAEQAHKFRIYMRFVQALLFFWLVITCVLSWYVGFGNAAIAQRNIARADLDAAEAKAHLTPEQKHATTGDLCLVTTVDRQHHGGEKFAELTEIEVCDARNRLSAVDATVASWIRPAQRLRNIHLSWFFSRDWPWVLGRECFRGGDAPPDKPPPGAGQQVARENASYGSALLRVLGTAVLPIFYGVIGAGIAVVRGVSRKTKLSQLAPRDRPLTVQQLALGAAMGACIGLFMAEPSSTTDSAPRLASTVALSSAALSFVAGFGVEHVFTALDALIRRVFIFDNSTDPQANTPRPRRSSDE